MAQRRLIELIRIGSDAAYRLTAREVWGFLISLFFGQRCPRSAYGESSFRKGLWWNRLFEGVGQSKLDQIVISLNDLMNPLEVARASDADLWLGRGALWDSLPVTQTSPARFGQSNPEEALRAFTDVKRETFFFDESWDTDAAVSMASRAGEFGSLVTDALSGDRRETISRIVEALNEYRSGLSDDEDFVLARHNQFNVSKRVQAYISVEQVSVDSLELGLPYESSLTAFPEYGFRPREVHLYWQEAPSSVLVIDLDFWTTVRAHRTVYVDRTQEAVDYALDLFMAAAPSRAQPVGRIEVLVPDRRVRREYRLRRRTQERSIELSRP